MNDTKSFPSLIKYETRNLLCSTVFPSLIKYETRNLLCSTVELVLNIVGYFICRPWYRDCLRVSRVANPVWSNPKPSVCQRSTAKPHFSHNRRTNYQRVPNCFWEQREKLWDHPFNRLLCRLLWGRDGGLVQIALIFFTENGGNIFYFYTFFRCQEYWWKEPNLNVEMDIYRQNASKAWINL